MNLVFPLLQDFSKKDFAYLHEKLVMIKKNELPLPKNLYNLLLSFSFLISLKIQLHVFQLKTEHS